MLRRGRLLGRKRALDQRPDDLVPPCRRLRRHRLHHLERPGRVPQRREGLRVTPQRLGREHAAQRQRLAVVRRDLPQVLFARVGRDPLPDLLVDLPVTQVPVELPEVALRRVVGELEEPAVRVQYFELRLGLRQVVGLDLRVDPHQLRLDLARRVVRQREVHPHRQQPQPQHQHRQLPDVRPGHHRPAQVQAFFQAFGLQ